MYVKVLDYARNRSAVLYTTDDQQPLDFGKHRLESNPAVMKWEELAGELRISSESWDMTKVDGEPTGYRNEETPFWEVGWVRFRRPGLPEVHLVAATSPIYILDHSGKTIDRV